MNLKQKAIRGVKWTSLSTIVSALLQILQVAILARFLSPQDFGLMAIVMVIIGFAQAFLDMGISSAIIHKQDVTHKQLSTLYWLNVLSGFILYFMIWLLSPTIATFYNESSLEDLIKIVGVIFLITPFGQQFFVLLEKDLKFDTLAKITIFNKIISLFVASYLAYMGYGVYALVYGAIISAFFTTSQYIMIGSKKHKPSLVFSLKQVRYFLQFGLYQMGEKTINYFNSQFDTILIGKLLGVDSLGIYTIAKGLIMKPATIVNPIVTRVGFPLMSQIQNDINRLKSTYLKMINFIVSINFPIYIAIIILAPELVILLFGPQWEEAIPLIKILGIFGGIRSIINPVGSLLLAKGRADLGFWWNAGLFLYSPLSIYIYSYWGLNGIAWGLVANIVFVLILSYFILIKPLCKVNIKEYFWQIIRAFLIALIVYMVVYNIYILLYLNIFLKIFIVFGLIFILTYLLNYYYNAIFISEIKGFVKR